MLRTEARSGQIEGLAHVVSAACLSDCRTKAAAKQDALVKAVSTNVLKNLDLHPPSRSLFDTQSLSYAMASLHIWPSGTICELLWRSTSFCGSLVMPSPPSFDPSLGDTVVPRERSDPGASSSSGLVHLTLGPGALPLRTLTERKSPQLHTYPNPTTQVMR